jgi:LacI family repressor for deo operon, udp, cdd, tsx, nupC, and nupG
VSGIVEIAKQAGVSPATVSRALRGMHHVNERTRKKIIEAAQLLDYPVRPDLLPQSASTRTNTIGVIAPFISRWYFSQTLAGIEQALREAGIDLLLYNFAQVDARQRIFQQRKLVGKVDGLIVISLPPTEKEFEQILGLGIPVSLLGVANSRCSSISIDDVKGAELAATHLVEMGHSNIAIMVGQNEKVYNFEVSSQRKTGLINVLNAHGIEFNPQNEIVADFDIRTAELAMDEFLRRKKLPTAIFCESDEMAFGVIKSIRKKGLRVPEDISVIGYDDHEYAELMGVTTIAQPAKFLGQLAASQIMAQIEKPDSAIAQIKVPTNLVVRSSVKNLKQ